MCGITGIHFKDPRDKGISQRQFERLVDELLLGIESRGRDATGLLVVDANGVPELTKADTDATKFIQWRGTLPRRVRTVLGHTRLATQGRPENLDNDHPVQYGTCYAVHNGHVFNDAELFAEHSLGRNAEVDSEIIPALFDKFGLDKAHLALQELDGNVATAVVDPARFPNQMILAKGYTSPVHYVETKYGLVFASTEEALRKAFEKALGWTPKFSDMHSMLFGDLLYLDGDKVETLSFKPKVKAYTSKLYSSSTKAYYYDYQTGRSGTRIDMSEECKACGCSRAWHGEGANISGRCSHVIQLTLGGEWACRCESFVSSISEEKSAFEFCDGCGREFPLGDLKKVGKNYFCPTACAQELFSEGPTADELRKAAEAITAAQVQTAEELAEGDEESYAAWEAREATIASETLKLASKQVGLTAKFMEWLLFKAPIELFNADQSDYLTKAHEVADAAYKSVEDSICARLLELDIARWTSGDKTSTELVVMGPTTPCGKCGAALHDGEECGDCAAEVCGVVVEMFPSEEAMNT